MTAVSLRQIVDHALAEVGIRPVAKMASSSHRATRWSRELPGFGVRLYASGRRMYVVQTTMNGRLRTVTLCNAKLISRSQALDVARRIMLRAQTGGNPAEDRRATRATPSFDRFLDLYWEKASPRWKPSTRDTHDVYRRSYLDGAFQRKGLDKISQADVARWFADVAEKAGQGGANRVMSILRALFNKAEEWGMRPAGSNPTIGIKLYPQKRFARFLRPEELARIGDAMRHEAEARPQQIAALMLILLTGCRSAEITGLLWSEVAGSRLRLTDSKTGPKTVWLGVEATAILQRLPKVEGRARIFWSDARDRPLDVGGFWRQFRKRHGFDGLRIHDLRHSFASHGAAMSETLPMIGKLLGHSKIQSTARYAHLDDADLSEAAETVGNALKLLLD